MRALLRALATIVLAGLAIGFFPWPFVWVFLLGSYLGLWLFQRSHRIAPKILSLNICLISFVFAVGEAVLSWQDGYSKETAAHTVHDHAYDGETDDVLGWRLIKNSRWHAKKFYDGKLLYDVVVTVGDNGLRITPPCRRGCTQSILFFGCSYTYGQGVNDRETLPYQVALLTDRRYATYNFAVHGYGTHQMLAAIENGLVDTRVKEDARYIIYGAIYPEHIYRLAGLRSSWGHDPKYVLDSHGEPRYLGHFDDEVCRRWICTWVARQIEKSALITRTTRLIQGFFKVDDALFVAMVIKSRKLLLERFPNAEFHMIVWDQAPNEQVLSTLRNQGIKVHLIKDVLPSWWKRQYLIEHDGHPSALAYRTVSQYVVQQIIHE